jgi:hypothetical protein
MARVVVAAMEVHERSRVVINHCNVGHEHEIDATRASGELTGLDKRLGCLV